MKWILTTAILFYTTAKAQVIIDTFPNAKAYSSTYIPIYQYGVMANGHPYAIGLTLSLNPQSPYWITRTDLVTKVVTKKTLPGTISYQGGYWNSIFDSSGNFVLPINTDDYHVRLINMKDDSIAVNDIGLAFKDANGNFVTALAYSSSLGIDGSLYFGAKGNPYWSWRSKDGVMHYSPNAINNVGIDWVLAISGDATSIVAVTGQNDSCNAWIINKQTGAKKNIVRTSSATRPTLEVGCDGYMYVRNPDLPITVNQWYKIVNGDTVRVPTWSGCRVAYNEVNKGGNSPTVSSFFDPAKSKLFYVLNGVSDSADIQTNFSQSSLQTVIVDRYNPNRLYYVGAFYGTFYGYDILKDSSWAIGNLGYNLYSYRRLNDSIMFLGVYPGGALVEWNLNKSWTAETYVNQQIIHITDSGANPRIVFQFKNTDAAFSHLSTMYIDTIRNLVIAGGDVIRVDSSCSVGAYNYITKQGYGYDYHKIGALSVGSITPYGDKVLFSTTTRFGQTPYLYVYDPTLNIMTDSITYAGFTDFGGIWVQGDQLLGHAGTRFYKINLSTKHLLYNKTTTAININRLQDGKFVCNGGTCPIDWAQCGQTSNYNNWVGIGDGNYFSISNLYLIRNKNMATQTIDLNTAQGKQQYMRNLLYNR